MVTIARPPADWTEAIANVAREFMDCRVCFYRSTDGDYDPLTNTGTRAGIELIWVGSARVQHLRSPSKTPTSYEVMSSRAFRFQMDKDAGVPFLPTGTHARVLRVGVPGAKVASGDPHLTKLAYVVESAINASTQAVKTAELVANMREMHWEWDVDEDGRVT